MKRNVTSCVRKAFAVLMCSGVVFSLSAKTAKVFADSNLSAYAAGQSMIVAGSVNNNSSLFATAVADVTYSPDNGDLANPTTVPADQAFSISFTGPLYTYDTQAALNNIKVDDTYMQDCIKLLNTDDNVEVSITVVVSSWSDTGTELTVTPTNPLESEKHYSLIVLDDKLQYGVKNVSPLGNSDFIFDVYAQNDYVIEDTTVPMLDETRDDGLWQDGYYVGSGETILTGDQLKLDFVEPVQAGTGNIYIYTWNGNVVDTIDASGLTTDPSDPSIIIVSDVSGLTVDESYYVIVEPGAITDLAGNPFGGVNEEDDWSFTVRDDQKPDVVSYTPVGTNVKMSTDLMIEFDLPVDLGAGNVNLYLADGTLVQTLNVGTDAMYFSIIGNKVYIDIDPLLASTDYMVSVDAGAFVSGAGETNDAIASTDWQFETETDQAPLLIDLTPDDNSVEVPLDQQFVMEFNMDVQAGSGPLEVHLNDGKNTLVISLSPSDNRITISGSTVTIDLSGLLEEGKEYYIIAYPDFVKNTSATPESYAGLTKVFNWNFTMVTEKIPPEVLSLSPDSEPTPTDSPTANNHPTFVMTFDEAVQLSPTGGNIYVYESGTSTLILTIPLTSDMFSNNIATIDYVYDGVHGLGTNTDYYVIVDAGAIEDINGNDYAGISDPAEWTFTTGADLALGIEDELAAGNAFIVYPNPFSDVLYLTSTDKIDRIAITNVLGQRVKEINNPTEAISTSDLRNGIYIISLMLDNVTVSTQRIIKR